MARKVRGLERVLDAPALFAVAYDEIGSSLYFALGIVTAAALGFTPLVLLLAGLLFLLISISYAEGVAAIPETGGASTFVRRSTNDVFGFVTGWVIFLDYLIVIALSTLFLPHYLGTALHIDELRSRPWDVVASVAAIAVIIGVRLWRHSRLHLGGIVIAAVDLGVQLLLVLLGFVFLFSGDELTGGLHFGDGLGWYDLAFALPLAMLAYTGLETVANLAEETREPGRTLPRSLFSAIGLVVLVTTLVAVVGVTAFPPVNGTSELGTTWLEAPLVGIVVALGSELPSFAVDALRVVVGLSGALVLFAAATTAISGCVRLALTMGEHRQLPRIFSRRDRRTVVPRAGLVATGLVTIVIVVVAAAAADDEATFLASTYSFGVLLAFAGAQVAVVVLRIREPDLPRPFRARPEITVRGVRLPVVALVGAPLTLAVWVASLVTHPGARYAGPAWLLGGLLLYAATRWWEDRGLLDEIGPIETLPPGVEFRRVLVPMKLGDIGEEMVATAIALARDRDASVEAVFVVRVPRQFTLEGRLPPEIEQRARASLDEAQALGEENDVPVATRVLRARSIGRAIVDEAVTSGADLIVLGSSPRWRRQSRFFSPTVDYVLRHAPCEVLVVAFPDGMFEESATLRA
jgi:APA family basic amino acid/polyamine antiporter